MKKLIAVIFFTIVSTGIFASEYTTKVASVKGEKWWGVFVSGAYSGPFDTPFCVNTASFGTDGFVTPLLVSSAGRYVWSDTPITIDFDGEDLTIGSDYGKVEAVKGGRNLREAYLVACHKHFPPSGELPAVELFTTPIYDTRLEMGYMQNQDDVLDYASRLLQEGFPAGIILLCDGWSRQAGEYAFDTAWYPDAKMMCDRLHEMGFKLMLTVTPYIAASGRVFTDNHARERILMLNSTPVIVEADGGYYAAYDLSDNAVAQDIHAALVELTEKYGVDGFRFDCRGMLPHLADLGDRSREYMENWVGLCSAGHLCEYLPGLNTPLTPYINCMVSEGNLGWEELSQRIRKAVGAGLAGFSYSHISPVGADPSTLFADENLMLRSLQLACFMPVPTIAFAPWRIKDPVLYKKAKETVTHRVSIAAYLNDMIAVSARTAEPIVRHMEYQFPRSGFADCGDQFMIGSKYLVVPVLDNRPTRMVRLPRGVWTDAEGRRYRGPVVTQVDVSKGQVPVFENVSK